MSFGRSQATLPPVLGSSFLVMFFGAIFMGAVADRIGPRSAFLLDFGIYSLFMLAGRFSPNAFVPMATRFFAGIGIGAQIPLSDAYLSLGGIVVWGLQRDMIEWPRWLEGLGGFEKARSAAALVRFGRAVRAEIYCKNLQWE